MIGQPLHRDDMARLWGLRPDPNAAKSLRLRQRRGLVERVGLSGSHDCGWALTEAGWAMLQGDPVGVVPPIPQAQMPPAREPASPVMYDPATDKYLARNGRYGAIVGQLGPRVRAIAEALIDTMDAPTPLPAPVRPVPLGDWQPGPVVCYFGLTDLHFGLGTPRADIDAAIDRQMSRIARGWGRPAHVLMPVGSDALHVDTIHGTTTRGTAVHPTMTAQDAYDHAVRWYVDTAQRMRAWAGDCLHLLPAPGNHDRLLSHAVMRHLQALYGQAPDVRVYDSAAPWTQTRIGRTLWHVEHGDRRGGGSIGEVMARSRDWSGTALRFALTGHLHHLEARDRDGYFHVQCRAMARQSQYDRLQGYPHRPGVTVVVAPMSGEDDVWVGAG